uniref:Bgt_avrF2_2 n=1 Tax=Blumeria graminis f. sp. tritici TaxID=62690 RepID=A0A0P0GD46_BLUGR|nr:Bgt_avrF2_2 [Blumeria graminis f. sp. tritici]
MKIFSLISSVAILSHLTPGIEAATSNYRCRHLVLGSVTIDSIIAHTFVNQKDKLQYDWQPNQKFATGAFDLDVKDVNVLIEVDMDVQKKVLDIRVLALDQVFPCKPTQERPNYNEPLPA